MKLFLYISLGFEPLYLPGDLFTEVKKVCPFVQLFHIDEHSSAELIATGVRALGECEMVFVFVEIHGNAELQRLFPVLKKIVSLHVPVIWNQSGEQRKLKIFRNQFSGTFQQFTGTEQMLIDLNEFFL